MIEGITEDSWCKDFLTKNEDGTWSAWDETQANIIGTWETYEEARDRLMEYACRMQ